MQSDILSFYERKRARSPTPVAQRSVLADRVRFPRTLGEWYGVDVSELTQGTLDRVRSQLTIRPKHFGVGRAPEPYELFVQTKERVVALDGASDDAEGEIDTATVMWVPYFFGTGTFGSPERVLRVLGAPMDDHVAFDGTLSAPQQEAFRATVDQMCGIGGAVLVRKPGGGKTVLGISIACHLRRRTLVVCHTSALVGQWEQRVRQFAPAARIGRIQQKKTDVDADFVIAMMQSLCLRDYGPAVLQDFGLTILDEAHHVPAKTYMSVTKKLKSKFLLALTATPDRKDGLQRLLHYGFGPISHTDPGDAMEAVRVFSVTYRDGSTRMRTTRSGVVDMPNMITDLAKDARRTQTIATCVKKMYCEGRHTIVLSDRIRLLDDLCEMLQAGATDGIPSADLAYFVGSRTTEADRERAKTRRVILATFHEAREGLDVPSLDGAVFATPIGDARQAVGRIQRPNAQKLPPVLYDVVDAGLPCFVNMAKKRDAWYRRNGFSVSEA